MNYHLTDSYLLNPTHRITVNLIGLGGTGSNVLTGLYRLNEALLGIGHAGIKVTAWDADIVSEANIGRQLFSPADIGYNKADVLVSRVNRYAGYDWTSKPRHFITPSTQERANITISCVDTIRARLDINKAFSRNPKTKPEPNFFELYWMDYGNQHKTGQVVLGAVNTSKIYAMVKPADVLKGNLKMPKPEPPTVIDIFPELKKQKDKATVPSCSLAQALGKQDLYINSTLAQFGLNILWKLFREGRISHHGAYVNLETLSVNPIKIA